MRRLGSRAPGARVSARAQRKLGKDSATGYSSRRSELFAADKASGKSNAHSSEKKIASSISERASLRAVFSQFGFESLVKSDDSAHRIFKVIEDLYSSTKENILPENTFFFQMSDAIVRVLCLARRSKNEASIAEEFSALADIQLSLLESGVVVRGGVSMGQAYVGKTGDGPVFGPAMIRAYHIESEEAVYPRIVIDDEFIRRVKTQERQFVQVPGAPKYQQIARILSTSEDGTLYVDYLRVAFFRATKVGGDIKAFREMLALHRALIIKGLDQDDLRRKRKYEWLARYHNGRIRKCITKQESSKPGNLKQVTFESLFVKLS